MKNIQKINSESEKTNTFLSSVRNKYKYEYIYVFNYFHWKQVKYFSFSKMRTIICN